MAEYNVTKEGDVFNVKTGRKLKHSLNKNGYHCVCLTINGKNMEFLIHRLVAIKYISNPNNLPQVNHIDGNKNNNSIDNLEWCTSQYNVDHAINMGLRGSIGVKNGRAKLTEEDIKYIRNSKERQIDLANIFNVTQPTISHIKNNKRWSSS